MLLDTSAVIDILNDTHGVGTLVEELVERNTRVMIPAPVAQELWIGVGLAKDRVREERKVRSFLDNHEVVPFAELDARETGELAARLRQAGTPMGCIDLQVAGMALARDVPLLTGDHGFDIIEDQLELIRYRDP